MQLTVNLTRKDYIAFLNYYLLRKRIWGRILFYLILVAVVMSFSANEEDFESREQFIRVMIVVSVTFTLIATGISYFFGRIMGEMYLRRKNISLGERTFILGGNTFTQHTPKGNSNVPWSSFQSMRESRNYYFLFVSKATAFIIPKRHFASQEEEKKFVHFVNEKIRSKN